jgi:hypothetical protein
LIALLALVVGAPERVTATKLDGTVSAGRLQDWSADEIVLATADGPKSLPTSDLLTLEFSNQATGDIGQPLLELVDGSVLPLAEYTANGNKAAARLQLPSPAEPQQLSVPVGKVHAVRLKTLAADVLPQWQEIRKLGVPSDLIVVAKRGGRSLDHLECVVREVTEAEVAFELDGKTVRVPLSKVAGLIYYRDRESRAEAPPLVLSGADGLRIAAAKVRARDDGMLQVSTEAGATLTWPLSAIASVDLSAGKLLFLSDIEPTSESWRPLVGLPTAASRATHFGQARINRSASGGPLTLAYPDADPTVGTEQVKVFNKGLALRSRSELIYRLPTGFHRFLAEAGIEPATAASGNVLLSIFGDDRLLVEQAIDGADDPLSLDLDVTGVKRLKIIVDYGKNLDTGDWLNLCNVRVVK